MIRQARALVVGFVLSASPAWAIDFDRYHSLAEIDAYLRDVAEEQPGLVRYAELGTSERGRTTSYLVISKALESELPTIYLNGTHHGDEKSSTESVLAVIEHLIAHQDEPEVDALLRNYAVYLQPVVNADGHAAHTRGDAYGRDPNRDYSYPERSEERSFKVAGIKAVKNLVDQIKPRAAIAYHSGMLGVLWPWAHSSGRTDDQDVFHTLAKSSAEAMGFSSYLQSYYDYPTNGEFIDHVYWRFGTLAVTIEVSRAATPDRSRLAGVVANAVRGTMQFLTDVMALDAGDFAVEPAPDQMEWASSLLDQGLIPKRVQGRLE